ncbi:MAG: 8-amino-7-oxononanoate synthase [Phycisphaeraceae bacterium]|nr:8-amino-7-oxononanoate synthase [Phycisphaeraceae bacterium]
MGWRQRLAEQLAKREAASLRRELVWGAIDGPYVERDGRRLVNFASNDYLALAGDPRLARAASEAARVYGTGAGASRLVTGSQPVHGALERRWAAYKHDEAALLCPTGFMANLAVVTGLAGEGDLVCLDKLDHASLIDAARLSGATVRVYPHRRPDKLERLLAEHQDEAPEARRLVVTDGVFSMDGDVADLPALADLAEAHDAILVVDEAHGTGVLGEGGRGLAEAQGVSDRVPVSVATASKALGGLGGLVSGPQVVIDTLVNHARSFIYTTGAMPIQAAVIGAALTLVEEEPDRRQRLAERARAVRQRLAATEVGGEIDPDPAIVTPIVPLIVGEADRALALATHLGEAGLLAPAIRPPTVAPDSSRIRISLRADHTDRHIDQLVEAVAEWGSGG